MAAPVITLADDLLAALNDDDNTPYTFERRVGPYLKKEDVAGGKWIVVPAGEVGAIRAREVDRTVLTVDVGYQEALPEKTAEQPNPLENLPWFDERMSRLEVVKALFRGSGDLRNTRFDPGGEFVLQSMENTPIYRPDLMTDYQIFTAVVRLEFAGEITS